MIFFIRPLKIRLFKRAFLMQDLETVNLMLYLIFQMFIFNQG